MPKKLTPAEMKEEAMIAAQVADDPDDYMPTDEELASARPFAEVLPDLAGSIRRSRGRPRLVQPKQPVTLRLDADVAEKLRASGRGWQSRVNATLRRSMGL